AECLRDGYVTALAIKRTYKHPCQSGSLSFEHNWPCRVHSFLPAFGEFLDHLLVKRWNVIWPPTADESIIHRDFPVDPICSGVAHVRLNCGGPRGHGSVADQTRADEHLRSMANGRHRFSLAEEMTRKFKRILICSQRIRI